MIAWKPRVLGYKSKTFKNQSSNYQVEIMSITHQRPVETRRPESVWILQDIQPPSIV